MPIDTSNIEAITREIAEAQARAKEAAKVALKDGFRLIFEEYPFLGRVAWAQYTPYFNDGDACVFGVNEPQVRVRLSPELSDAYRGRLSTFLYREDDEEVDEEEPGMPGHGEGAVVTFGGVKPWGIEKLPPEERAEVEALLAPYTDLFRDLGAFVGGHLEEAYLEVFGDHVRVEVHKNLVVTTEEYSHD